MTRFSWKVAAAVALLHATAALGDPAPDGSTPASSPSGNDPTIAKPAPDAPPKKVEEAKEVAKSAELTPIVPNPNGSRSPG
ncbi:MAG: hypothetical protein E6J90_02350 [Deltaproteobacteria bacterium]|nr:MAG: hypothetical protein E6J90_02350 [Deltaproteobacteria bacterium]